MTTILAIAGGGAFGAILRHYVGVLSVALAGSAFPVGTLAVNIIGSLLMGALVSIFALYWAPSEAMKAFLTVGFLGAFTTFSTFSLDVVTLWERQAYWAALGYGSASVILSIAALVIGMLLVRAVLS